MKSSNSTLRLTFRNPIFGIELKYPRDWTFEPGADLPTNIIDSAQKPSLSTVAKFSPVELYEKNDYLIELQYFNLLNGLSTKELAQEQLNQSGDWRMTSRTNDTVDGYPALKINLSNNQTVGNNLRKTATYVIANNNIGYGIIYQAAFPDPYLKYESIGYAIMHSIKLSIEKTSSDTVDSIFDGNAYENPTYGIRIGYPKDWTYENQDLDIDRAIYHAGDVDGQSTIVEFTPPGLTTPNYFSLDITFYNLPYGTSLEKFVQDEIDDFSSWTVISRNTDSVSGHTAERVVSTQNEDTNDFRRIVLYTLINGKGYSIDYSDSYPSPYQQYVTDIENMMKTFQVSGITSLDKPIQWTIFKDNNLGVSLEYPFGWEVEYKQSKFEKGPEVTISDNSESGTGSITIGGIIRLRSSLYDAELAAIQAQNALTEKEGTRLIENVDMDKYRVAGKESGSFLYSYPNPLVEAIPSLGKLGGILTPDDYAQQVVVTIYNKKIYAFGFSATTGDFEGYNDIMDHVFSSIKFIKQN